MTRLATLFLKLFNYTTVKSNYKPFNSMLYLYITERH